MTSHKCLDVVRIHSRRHVSAFSLYHLALNFSFNSISEYLDSPIAPKPGLKHFMYTKINRTIHGVEETKVSG